MAPAEQGPTWSVDSVPTAATHDLRRRLLRGDRADAVVTWPGDDDPATVHLGVWMADHSTPVGVASFTPQAAPTSPGRRAVRLRGMAVEPAWQGRGAGRALLDEALRRLRGDGVEVLWADGRDSALGFYRRLGMEVVGEAFLKLGLPHHVVVLDLTRAGAEPEGSPGHGEAD